MIRYETHGGLVPLKAAWAKGYVLAMDELRRATIGTCKAKEDSMEMKTIGLLGGMSWESTLQYYRIINQGVKNALGGLHSARIVLYSLDFDPLEKMLSSGNLEELAQELSHAAMRVETAGADFLLICTNTMHLVALDIEDSLEIPVLHIADATAETLIIGKIYG